MISSVYPFMQMPKCGVIVPLSQVQWWVAGEIGKSMQNVNYKKQEELAIDRK